MEKSQWALIFILILILIGLLFVWAYRDKIFPKASATNTNTNNNLATQSCNSMSYNDILALQKQLNSKGCTDYNGNKLVEDGLCGPLTNSAILNCQNK